MFLAPLSPSTAGMILRAQQLAGHQGQSSQSLKMLRPFVSKTMTLTSSESSTTKSSQSLHSEFRFAIPHSIRRDLVVQITSDSRWLATHGLIGLLLLFSLSISPLQSQKITVFSLVFTSFQMLLLQPRNYDDQLETSCSSGGPDSNRRKEGLQL